MYKESVLLWEKFCSYLYTVDAIYPGRTVFKAFRNKKNCKWICMKLREWLIYRSQWVFSEEFSMPNGVTILKNWGSICCLLTSTSITSIQLVLKELSVLIFCFFFHGKLQGFLFWTSLPLKTRFVLPGTHHALNLISFPEGFGSMVYKKY